MMTNFKCAPASVKTKSGRQDHVNFMQQDGDRQDAGSGIKKNSAGKLDCFNCGKDDHWSYECPELTAEKRAILKSKYDKRQEGCLHAQISVKLKKVDVAGKLEVIVEGNEPEIGISMLLSSE